MTVSINLTRQEEIALVAAVVETFPAAAPLKSVKIEDGQVRASIVSPVGDLDVILELRVTNG